jgi:hypothetical protein
MSIASPSSNLPPADVSIPWWKILTVLVLGILVAAAFSGMQSINQHGEPGISMTLPGEVAQFSGTPQEVSSQEKSILPNDTEFAKMLYKDPAGHQASVQIVLAGVEKRSIHRPEICLPAQGWTIDTREPVPVKLDNGKTLDIMKLQISRTVEVRPGETRLLHSVFLYWFVGDHVSTPYHWVRILRSSWDRVVHQKNHRWAYVIVSAPALKGIAPDGLDADQTQTLLEGFISKIAPEIMREPPVPGEPTAKLGVLSPHPAP